MPGPMDPRTDKTARLIYLDSLRRQVAAAHFDKLDLENLKPLRDEIQRELDKLSQARPVPAP